MKAIATDPFEDREAAHPKARELMSEEFFWDIVDERAPFGSDEGNDSYYEWISWRERNVTRRLTVCLNWILAGRLSEFNSDLVSDKQVQKDVDDPSGAFLADHFDIFTMDTTIIATGLSQLISEGKVDGEAKPYLDVALRRQMHSLICGDAERKHMLSQIQKVFEEAYQFPPKAPPSQLEPEKKKFSLFHLFRR